LLRILAGITGSASGGMSIALAAMSEQFIDRSQQWQISQATLAILVTQMVQVCPPLRFSGALIL
jgi:H+/gluconate symporter-like permease